MKRAIVTPTFQPHFKFIKKFLDSAVIFILDPENVTFFLTVSEEDVSEITDIVRPYQSKLDIKIISFNMLLKKFNVPYSDKRLLSKYGKFSYQTLKKFYTLLEINYDQMLVLDSESMFIRETNISVLFDSFFNKPFITICELDYLPNTGWFKQRVMDNISLILNKNSDDELEDKINKYNNVWSLENFVWFYDKNILNDMFKELGNPLSVIDFVYKNAPKENREQGCFEICLYQMFIYKNNEIYNYEIYKTKDILENAFQNNHKLYSEYERLYYSIWGGEFGILEMIMCLLTKKNTINLAKALKNYNFTIIRCDFTNLSNYKYQKEFLDILKPNILAASQGHIWGINNKIYNRVWNLFIVNNVFMAYIRADLKNISRPFKPLKRWLRYFYYILKHLLLWLYQLFSNLNIFRNK